MDSAKGYILTVVSVCIICGIIRKLVVTGGGTSAVINIICGTILAITVISPLVNINIKNIDRILNDINTDNAAYVQSGIDSSDQKLREIISDKVCAYILEKTSSYDCSINSVHVSLSDDNMPAPESLQIEGTFSPYIKNRLAEFFATNLGIPKEKQQWTYQD